MIHTPWAHQTEALEFIAEKPGAMLAMDMGTGKSRVIVDLIARKGYQKVLILAPLSVVAGVWPGEFSKHAPGLIHVLPLVGQSTKKRQEAAEKAMLAEKSKEKAKDAEEHKEVAEKARLAEKAKEKINDAEEHKELVEEALKSIAEKQVEREHMKKAQASACAQVFCCTASVLMSQCHYISVLLILVCR